MADLLFPVWEKRRLMVMLGGFHDESGTSRESRVLVVGGYIAEARSWKRFQGEWLAILLKAGLDPRTTPFSRAQFEARNQPHMKDKTPYSDWSDGKASAVLDALLTAITKTALVGVVTALAVDDYEDVTAQMQYPVSRYYFCVLRCLAQTIQWLEDNKLNHDVAHIFEDGADNRKEIDMALGFIFADEERRRAFRLNDISKKSKREFLQLQAADIAVWETRRYAIDNRLRSGGGIRNSLQALLKVPHYTEFWDRERLVEYATAISAYNGPEYRQADGGNV